MIGANDLCCDAALPEYDRQTSPNAAGLFEGRMFPAAWGGGLPDETKAWLNLQRSEPTAGEQALSKTSLAELVRGCG
jgi:hypothetical protein